MKKCILFVCLAILLLFLCACHAAQSDGGSNGTSAPAESAPTTVATEPKQTSFLIIAPNDQLSGAGCDAFDLQIADGYCLLKNRSPEQYAYYDPYTLTNAGFTLQMYPLILETEIETLQIQYEARTNFSGFFTTYAGVNGYVGKQTSFETHIHWRGLDVVPKEEREQEKPDRVWLDLVVFANGKIAGMAVFELVPWNEKEHTFTAQYQFSEYYPCIDGLSQDIPEAFVWQRIDAYHRLVS